MRGPQSVIHFSSCLEPNTYERYELALSATAGLDLCLRPMETIIPEIKNTNSATEDDKWMLEALALAGIAATQDEVPVGAVIIYQGQIVGRGYNKREIAKDPLAHAEILAITEASQNLERWRLSDCKLYVTLEPCLMCAGAIINSRISRVVFGALDPKAGAVQSVFSTLNEPRLNHRPEVRSGVLAVECGQILTQFFQRKRLKAP